MYVLGAGQDYSIGCRPGPSSMRAPAKKIFKYNFYFKN
jgi:hypothetical protein